MTRELWLFRSDDDWYGLTSTEPTINAYGGLETAGVVVEISKKTAVMLGGDLLLPGESVELVVSEVVA